ncbi:MAG: hypothetical protein JWO38_2818 [Gemmataceae bacterium]|nr:hypothetical protein [Gemmataceae bacterium]
MSGSTYPVENCPPTITSRQFPSPNRLQPSPLEHFALRWPVKRADAETFTRYSWDAAKSLNARLPGFRIPDEVWENWRSLWVRDLFLGFIQSGDRLPPSQIASAVEDVCAGIEALRGVMPRGNRVRTGRFWVQVYPGRVGFPHFPTLQQVRQHHPEFHHRVVSGESPGGARLDAQQFLDRVSFLLNEPTEADWDWLERLAYEVDPPELDEGESPDESWARRIFPDAVPRLSLLLGVEHDPRIEDIDTSFPVLVGCVQGWCLKAREAVKRQLAIASPVPQGETSGEQRALTRIRDERSTQTSAVPPTSNHSGSGTSNPYERLYRLQVVAPRVEDLAREYWSRFEPLHASLSVAVNAPLNDRAQWERCVFGTGSAIRADGLTNAPATVRDSRRWNYKPPDEGWARAGWVVSDLLDLAVKEDFQQFQIRSGQLFGDPEGLGQVPAVFREIAGYLCSKMLERLNHEFLERAKAVVDEIGEPFDILRNRLIWNAMNARAQEAVSNWIAWKEFGDSNIPKWCFIPPVTTDTGPVPSTQEQTQPSGKFGSNSDPPPPTGPEKSEGGTPPEAFTELRDSTHDRAQSMAVRPRRGNETAIPAVVRNWLIARYLSDPTPGQLRLTKEADLEPIVLVQYGTFAEYLLHAGFELLPNLDNWKNAGWIADMMVDIRQTDDPNDSPHYCIARLNLPVGRHRLVGIRRPILDAPTDSVPLTDETRASAGDKPKRIPRAEAEFLVRDWLVRHAKENPVSVTRDAVRFPKVGGVGVKGVNSPRGGHQWPARFTPGSSSSKLSG